MSVPKSKIEWIDASRGIAFLMIIYSHIDFTNKWLMAYFSPVFLSTFFFVSGYLFNKDRGFFETIEQRFRTLIIPWLFYGLLIIFSSQILSFHEHNSLFVELYRMFMAVRGDGDNLWFLACLFVVSPPFYLYIKYIPKNFLLPLALTLLILNGFVFHGPVPWYIHFIAPAIFYMVLGYMFRNYEYCFEFLGSFRWLIFIAAIYIFEVTLSYYLSGNFISFTPTSYIVDGLIITITGILLVVAMSRQIKFFRSLFIFVGANSLLYFCLHGKTFSLLQKIYYKASSYLISGEPSSLFIFVLGIVITFLTAYILIFPIVAINRYLPWTVGKNFRICF